MGRRMPNGDTDAGSRYTVNNVLLAPELYARLRAWCDDHDMRIGVLVGKAIAEWMKREGLA